MKPPLPGQRYGRNLQRGSNALGIEPDCAWGKEADFEEGQSRTESPGEKRLSKLRVKKLGT